MEVKVIRQDGRVYWRTSGVPSEIADVEVSLARRPDHCFYKLTELDKHDFHAPFWYTEGEREAYITRVLNDIKAAQPKASNKPAEDADDQSISF